MSTGEGAAPNRGGSHRCGAVLSKIDLNKPLLPTRDACQKHTRKCDVKDCHPQDKVLFGCGGNVLWNGRQQCCAGLMSCFCVYFVLFAFLQFLCFHFATVNCAQLPDDYVYPGGGHGQYSGPADNLVPRNSIVAERDPMWYGAGFDVYNSTEGGFIDGAPVGTWFRTWGPWFSTYTYQDIQNSKETVYMRPSILGMWFYVETVVMRCDGKGTPLWFSEGSNWIANRIRMALRMNTAESFKLWRNGELIATAEETFRGAKSVTFRNATAHNQPAFASAVLLPHLMNHKYREWFIKNDFGDSLAFYDTNAVATLYAFHIFNLAASTKTVQQNQGPDFLAVSVQSDESENGKV